MNICIHCDKNFSTRGNLVRHINVCLKKVLIEKLKCEMLQFEQDKKEFEIEKRKYEEEEKRKFDEEEKRKFDEEEKRKFDEGYEKYLEEKDRKKFNQESYEQEKIIFNIELKAYKQEIKQLEQDKLRLEQEIKKLYKELDKDINISININKRKLIENTKSLNF